MLFITNSSDNFLVREFLLIIQYDHTNNFSYRDKKSLGEDKNREIQSLALQMTEALAPSSCLFQTSFVYFTPKEQRFGAKVRTELSLAPQGSGLASRLASCHLSVVIQQL